MSENNLALIIGSAGVLMLIAAAIIDFMVSPKQKNDTNKNSIIAAGMMSLIAAGFIIIFTFWVIKSP